LPRKSSQKQPIFNFFVVFALITRYDIADSVHCIVVSSWRSGDKIFSSYLILRLPLLRDESVTCPEERSEIENLLLFVFGGLNHEMPQFEIGCGLCAGAAARRYPGHPGYWGQAGNPVSALQ
jgi:hypothetical protein